MLIPAHAMPSFRAWYLVPQKVMESIRMTYKLALFAVALFAVWMILFRAGRRIPGPKRKPPEPHQALERCPRCNVYRLPGGACECDTGPTMRE